jgi:hypothetical protein
MREEYSRTLSMQELLVQQQYSQVMALAVQQQEVLRDELYGRPSASGSTSGAGGPVHRVSGGGSFSAASPRGSGGGSITAFGGVTRTVSEAGSRMGSLALVPEEEGESVMPGVTTYTNPLASVTSSSGGGAPTLSRQLSRQNSTKAEVLDQIQATLNTMKRLSTLKKLQAKADALAAMKITRSHSMGHGALYARGTSMSGGSTGFAGGGGARVGMRYSVSGALGLTPAGSSLGVSPLRQSSLTGTAASTTAPLGGHSLSGRRFSETAGALTAAAADGYAPQDAYPDPPSTVDEEGDGELATCEESPGPSPRRPPPPPALASSGPSGSASTSSPVGRPSNPGGWAEN